MTSFADFNEFIQRDLQPELVDTVIYDSIEAFLKYFNTQEPKSGDRITSKYRLGFTSNAKFFDKGDVDVAPATQVLKKPYWIKVQAEGMVEVHGLDLSNQDQGDVTLDFITDQIRKEAQKIADLHQAAFLTQIKNDVDSSSVAYSTAALSRSTYPLLASYEEATDATITLAYMRGMMQNVTLNKGVKITDYLGIMEGSVYYTFKALAAALHTWNLMGVANQKADMGYQDIGNFEGLAIADPTEFTNMTTGDVFMLRRQDVHLTPHLPLVIRPKESNRFSDKYALYTGTNIHVENPYLQGKMTDKD